MGYTNAKSIYVRLALAAGCLLAMASFAARSAWSFRDASSLVLHTIAVERQTDVVASAVNSLELNHRGYVITGERSFVEGAEGASAALRREVAKLRSLTIDNSIQQARLGALTPLIEAKIERVRENMALRESAGLAAAAANLNQPGRSLFSDIASRLDLIRAEEERLLGERQAWARRDGVASAIALGGGLLSGGGFLFAVFRLVRLRELDAIVLKRRSAEIQDLYENAPCGYHSVDAEGRFLAVNSTELRWLGYRREELVNGKRDVDLIAPGDQPRFREAVARLNEQGTVTDLAVQMMRSDGSGLPALMNAAAVYNEHGDRAGSRWTLYDHTERRRAEQLLNHAREYAESIVQTVRGPLLILTEGFRVKGANRAFYELFQTSPEQTSGRKLAEIGAGEWALPELYRALERILPERTTLEDFEVAADFAGIGAKVMLLNARRLEYPGQEEVFLLLAIEDITARKQAQQKLLTVNAELQQRSSALQAANEELESFSYSVSHDLRAPLRHISGFAQMLERQLGSKLDDKGAHYLNTITTAAKQMGTLIDELLAFSRIGRAEMRSQKVSLAALAADVLNTLKPDFEGRKIRWMVEALPEVNGDPTLLRQVLENLISNAIKYTRHAPDPYICVGTLRDALEGTIVFVRDNGAGFDPKHAGKLFGVFQRLHSAAEFEGNGVGLASVRRIVLRHGGRVWAEGKPAQGATFYFSLPNGAQSPPKTAC